jgi:hypothetical protein
MIRNSALVLLTAFLLGGCSTTEEKKVEKKAYSAETNRAFEMIERGYNAPPLRAAPVAVTPPQVQRQRPIVSKTIATTPVIETPNVVAPVIKTTPPKKRQSDKIIELNQNLAFYCMKHRKDPVFNNDEKKCMDHVERILTDCEKRSSNNDSKTLNCVKNRLSHKL